MSSWAGVWAAGGDTGGRSGTEWEGMGRRGTGGRAGPERDGQVWRGRGGRLEWHGARLVRSGSSEGRGWPGKAGVDGGWMVGWGGTGWAEGAWNVGRSGQVRRGQDSRKGGRLSGVTGVGTPPYKADQPVTANRPKPIDREAPKPFSSATVHTVGQKSFGQSKSVSTVNDTFASSTNSSYWMPLPRQV